MTWRGPAEVVAAVSSALLLLLMERSLGSEEAITEDEGEGEEESEDDVLEGSVKESG